MSRFRSKQVRYGLAAGTVAFIAGWASMALLVPEGSISNVPRWQSTIWLYLGAHGVEVVVDQSAIGLPTTIQPLTEASVPGWTRFLPVFVTVPAGTYVATQLRSKRIRDSISNGMAAGVGYLLTAIVAIWVADARPTMVQILAAGGALLLALWLGSAVLSRGTGGLSVISLVSLGTVVLIGLAIIGVGAAVVKVLGGILFAAFGTTGLVGGIIGVDQRISELGRRQRSDYPRLAGLRQLITENWMELVAVAVVLLALYLGLTGGLSQLSLG